MAFADAQRERGLRDEHGGAAVEFAIVLPLLFVVLFGIVEFSIVMYDRIQMASYARDLARYASVFTPPDTNPVNAANPRRSAADIVAYALSVYDKPGPGKDVIDFNDLGMTTLGNVSLVAESAAVLSTCPNVCTAADCFAEIRPQFTHDYLLFPGFIKMIAPGATWGSVVLGSSTKMRCE